MNIKKKSFTLIELMISIIIMSFIFTAAFELINKTKNNFYKTQNIAKIHNKTNIIYDLIFKDFYNSESFEIKNNILHFEKISLNNILYESYYIIKNNHLYKIYKRNINENTNIKTFKEEYEIIELLNIKEFNIFTNTIKNKLLIDIILENNQHINFEYSKI